MDSPTFPPDSAAQFGEGGGVTELNPSLLACTIHTDVHAQRLLISDLWHRLCSLMQIPIGHWAAWTRYTCMSRSDKNLNS